MSGGLLRLGGSTMESQIPRAVQVAVVILSVATLSSQVILSPRDILVANRKITVPLGRSVFVTPNDLQIRVWPGDSCKVTVLDTTDALSQRPGRLMPSEFPCDFDMQDVQYSHFGARNPAEDRVRLQIRYDSPSQTIIIPFTIQFEVSFVQLEVVTRNLPIAVSKLMGISEPINKEVLEFAYDRPNRRCKVTVLSSASGLPRYGVVMNDTTRLQMVDCDEFLEMGVRYQHTAENNSPDRDFIPLVVELMDLDGNLDKQEYFQVMARIQGGLENTRPQASYSALLVMEVDQFVMTAITPEILAAEDLETSPDKLIFNITTPLSPGEGHIVSTDDRNLPIKSFYQKDITDLKIAYKPPPEDSYVQRVFQVAFQVIDSDGMASVDPIMLMIVVKPMNTLAPVVTRNTGIQLFEGQSRVLRSDINFQISDENDLENVRIFVADGLRHGQLDMPAGQKFFTPADLDRGAVVYRHDDSDTYSDNIIFRMTDGKNEVEFLYPITVFPVDDEPPILNVNTGLEIRKNEVAEISPFVLSATDIDSDDASIRFVLERPFSTEGVILRRQFQTPPDIENWQLRSGVYEQVVSEFTQQDIVDGKMFYQHVGPHRSDFVIDKIRFRLADGGDPPNQSGLEEFIVKIAPVDDQLPYLYPNTPLSMSVSEFETTTFKRKFLRYTDDDTDDRKLKYDITVLPFDTDLNTPLGPGTIVKCDHPGRGELSSFTQSQVNHHKICFKPPSADMGTVPRIIQFAYTVTDASGNVLPDQRFTINVKPVDNKPPEVFNRGVEIEENGYAIIDTSMLDVQDVDTGDDGIKFELVEIPLHGILQLDEVDMVVGDLFGKDELSNGRILYLNTGDEIDNDRFKIDITDGVHHVPITFKVKVKSIDDEAPKLLGNVQAGILGISIEVPESSLVTLTADDFKATDPDTEDLRLNFIVERVPYEGFILNRGENTDRFTQKDIIDGHIQYQHTGGEVGAKGRNDSFTLLLTDRSDEFNVEGNKINRINVDVKILAVDNESPIVTVVEAFDVRENDKSPILPIHLDAMDIDTDDNEIVCTVTSAPTYGYIENESAAPGSEKSRVGMPVSAFTIGDVRRGSINYVQSVHEGVEPRRDRFVFRCSDGINNSPSYDFNLGIVPNNDEEPKVFLREFMVLEGMNLMIDEPILSVVDGDDPPGEITFYITKKPEHGAIVQQRPSGTYPIDSFTLIDISGESTIEYEHDDTETTSDSFEFLLTDGVHNVTKTVPIIVIPVDDETPRLTINNGLELERGGEIKTITDEHLKAEDLDSNDPDIIFIIRRIPKYGYLQRDLGRDRYQNLTLGQNFTQRDIDERKVQYVHTGLEGVRDLIKFDVTDTLNPLIDRYFYVTVEGIDMTFPSVINKGVELPEGGRVTLTTDLLSGTDLNTPDENLQFIVTRAPGRGHLESTDMPGVPITAFTQLELAGNKIRYVHSSEDEMKMDSFEFEVTDGFNPVARTFRISLSDVDNKKPIVMFQPLRLKEGDNKLITPFELRADDRDTLDENILFTITQVPVHGNILFNKTKIIATFTLEDLNENMISYQHDGSETNKDSFSFTVSDGTHSDYFVFPETTYTTRQPQMMHIEIVPVDNGTPQIAINKGVSTLVSMDGGSLGFPITEKYLRVEDRDSPDDGLKYTITVEPEHGYIINTNLGNKSISQWTQGDVARHQIEYVLIPGVNATADSFFFKIEDRGSNTLGNQPFHLNWAWISLEADKLFVNETGKELEVTLRRRGYLGETSFVTISVINGTAKVGEDINPRYADQVQFNPGQTEKVWRLRILDDEKYEERETFNLELSKPVMGVLEYPDVAKVTITDKEDESTVSIPEKEYHVSEDIGEILIPVRREGDLSDELMVICSTVQGSATGTTPSTVTSFSDYITRSQDHRSIVRFDKDEKEKYCNVMIIDDSLYEVEENFTVILTEPMGGKIGDNKTTVLIEPDKNDEPTFYFGESEYSVDESDGFVEIKVWRTGTDLSKPSSVTVRSRRTDPPSAKSGLDYIAVNKNLDFAPGVTMQTVRITVLDDLGKPRLEGTETFQVVLRMPMAAMLGEPSNSVIMINDSYSDVPSMQFKDSKYESFENDGTVKAFVVRSGDASHVSTVRCYTRQDTAKVMDDYFERPNTNASVITFMPGEYEKICEVRLTNDSIYEEDEKFRLVLGNPLSPGFGIAKIGEKNFTTITVKDNGDKSVVMFEKTKFVVKEPMFKEETSIVKIPVIRVGDVGETAVVTVNTKDGSADAGKDYNGIFKVLTFGKNVSRQEVEIEILHDGKKEMREVFTVHLKHKSGVAEIKNPKVMVFIEERVKVADVTFPSRPAVVSLRDYDSVTDTLRSPIQGYPVVCVTPCNPKHPDFLKTGELCSKEGINNTLTLFRWRTSAPTGADGVSSDLKDVSSNTYFASTKGIALDSIYFSGGSRIQCGARAVNTDGDPGLELLSEPVTVNTDMGICEPQEMNSIGAEPFTAKVRYTGPDDLKYPNKVRVAVTIPHRDGMLPIVSTRQLSNFELTLSRDGTRVATHRCSNLLDFDEYETEYGFITNATKNPNIIGETEPYQYSADIRSKPTLRFYRNLNMDSCLWEFVSYYDMSELTTDCGGEINTDGQVLNSKQSYVSMRVPLYVSYIFHSPVATGGWTHYDMQSQLQLTFVYDTAILWQNGISSPEGESGLQGYLYPTTMRIRDDDRLSVTFRTEARFRGQFVLGHKETKLESMVTSPDHPSLTFTLKLIRSEPTFEQPEQLWEFVSDYAVRDYSGLYKIQLIPCTTSINQEYSVPPICNPRNHLNFDLPIRFQQVSDPVPTKFSLDTDFHLMRKRALWLGDGSMGFGDETDPAFTPADKIYGRINVDPVQNLGSSFALTIEKVFLCSGKDGYIPKYDPANKEFGCVAESENLQHVFKILDKGAPYTQKERFRDIPFNARLALDDVDATALVTQPGADGFSVDCEPLFKVDGGRQWFLHAIYTVRSKENAARGIGKRSIEYHAVMDASRVRRDTRDANGMGKDGKGTNMARVELSALDEQGVQEVGTNVENEYPILLIVIISCIGLLLLICILIIVICIVSRRRKHTSPPPSPTNTIVVAGSAGSSRVVAAQHFNNDRTEV
ncbi:FRAS1-related extracellular matrix protein 2-like [Haliotis cracherodii]|uniref:FRAS1-related extracellular matrix protein 2-like n=1 Tax=Haliotis cracherodii TaxID=6455 RepID=UPI0039E8AC17